MFIKYFKESFEEKIHYFKNDNLFLYFGYNRLNKFKTFEFQLFYIYNS